MSKDKQELTKRLDRLEIQNEQLKLEGAHVKKDFGQLMKERSALQLELSATRVQLKYHEGQGQGQGQGQTARAKSVPQPGAAEGGNGKGEEDADFADELIAKVEKLTSEKEELAREVEEGRLLHQQQRRQLDQAKAQVSWVLVSMLGSLQMAYHSGTLRSSMLLKLQPINADCDQWIRDTWVISVLLDTSISLQWN